MRSATNNNNSSYGTVGTSTQEKNYVSEMLEGLDAARPTEAECKLHLGYGHIGAVLLPSASKDDFEQMQVNN